MKSVIPSMKPTKVPCSALYSAICKLFVLGLVAVFFLTTFEVGIDSVRSMTYIKRASSSSAQFLLLTESTVRTTTKKTTSTTSTQTIANNSSDTVISNPIHRPSIWFPSSSPHCTGSFISSRSPFSEDGIPDVMLRDAVLDQRYLTTKHQSPLTVRIMLYFTLHVSVRLARKNSLALIKSPDRFLSPFNVTVDYVLQSDDHLNRFKHSAYRKGMTNKKNLTVSEWRASLVITPVLPSIFETTKDVLDMLHSSFIHIRPSFLRFDGSTVDFSPSMSLSCVTGWDFKMHSLPLLQYHHSHTSASSWSPFNSLSPPSCKEAKGAILFSGTSLYGVKNSNPSYYSEVASFAARALQGPFQFDAVVMSVTSVYTHAEISGICHLNMTCMSRMRDVNINHMERIRDNVEKELEKLRVPRNDFKKLLFVPSCRLGSDFKNTEKKKFIKGKNHEEVYDYGPCSKSSRYGQYTSSLSAYAMLSPYFKWAVSYDMDEIILPEQSNETRQRRVFKNMASVLDEIDNTDKGFITISWLNIFLRAGRLRRFTKAVMSGQSLHLGRRFDSEERTERPLDCYKKEKTGRSAIRCDKGLGFRVHHPVVWHGKRDANQNLILHYPSNLITKGYRLIHLRKKPHQGMCEYDPEQKLDRFKQLTRILSFK